MPVALTETAIRAALQRAKEEGVRRDLADAATAGLRLRVTPTGTGTWVLACRDKDGAMRRFRVGDWPTMGIAQARREAQDLRADVRKGADPIADARRQREEAAKPKDEPVTLRGLLDAYEMIAVPGKKGGKGLRSWPEARRRIEDVFASYIEKAAISIEAPALQVTVDKHPSRSSAGAAVRYIRPVLAWGAKRALVTPGVAEALDQPEGARRKRQRALSREEIHAVLGALNDDNTYHAALRMLFLTVVRRQELGTMRWAEVDLKGALWTIPDSKTDKPLVIPLSRQAVALLRERLPVDENGRSVDPDPTALVFGTRNGLSLSNWDKATKALHAASGTSGWHRHDIRRSMATLLGDLGVAPHIVEIAQGHELKSSSGGERLGGTATTYNTSRYRAEHAAALQRLADALDGIAAGGAEVIPMQATAAS